MQRRYLKKVLGVLTAALLLTAAGCAADINTQTLVFRGENEYWKGEYTIALTEISGKDDSYETLSEELFTDEYKKELSDLASVGTVAPI